MPWTVPFTRCTSSPEPAEASSPTASPASSPSAPSSSSPSPAASSPCAGPEWPSGTTCAPSAPTTPNAPPPSLGCGSITTRSSSPEDSPARTYLAQARARASRAAKEVACGASSQEYFARWDRASSSWKTPPCLFPGDLESFSGTWPRSGMMLSGTCWRLATLARDTSESASGSPDAQPTVTVCGNNNRADLSPKSGNGLMTEIREREREHGRRPTPATGRTPERRKATATARTSERPSTKPPPTRAYPTPRVHDATHDGPSELLRHAPNLATLVKRIP